MISTLFDSSFFSALRIFKQETEDKLDQDDSYLNPHLQDQDFLEALERATGRKGIDTILE